MMMFYILLCYSTFGPLALRFANCWQISFGCLARLRKEVVGAERVVVGAERKL